MNKPSDREDGNAMGTTRRRTSTRTPLKHVEFHARPAGVEEDMERRREPGRRRKRWRELPARYAA